MSCCTGPLPVILADTVSLASGQINPEAPPTFTDIINFGHNLDGAAAGSLTGAVLDIPNPLILNLVGATRWVLTATLVADAYQTASEQSVYENALATISVQADVLSSVITGQSIHFTIPPNFNTSTPTIPSGYGTVSTSITTYLDPGKYYIQGSLGIPAGGSGTWFADGRLSVSAVHVSPIV